MNLLYAVAWQESRWHQDVYSCDGGVGLMQIQYYLVNDFNHASYINNTPCGLHDTSYDATVLQDNAYLGPSFSSTSHATTVFTPARVARR